MGNEADGVSEQDRAVLPLDPLVKHSTISLETSLLIIPVYSNDLIAPSLLKRGAFSVCNPFNSPRCDATCAAAFNYLVFKTLPLRVTRSKLNTCSLGLSWQRPTKRRG